MIQIYTASWFTKLPEGVFRISISRGAPRGTPGGWKGYRALAPGAWFKTASPAEYLQRYRDEVLAPLDPAGVVADLTKLSGGAPAALLCFEHPTKIHRGEQWCHRHLAATWLEQTLGITIQEVGFEKLDRFAALRAIGVLVPDYREMARRM